MCVILLCVRYIRRGNYRLITRETFWRSGLGLTSSWPSRFLSPASPLAAVSRLNRTISVPPGPPPVRGTRGVRRDDCTDTSCPRRMRAISRLVMLCVSSYSDNIVVVRVPLPRETRTYLTWRDLYALGWPTLPYRFIRNVQETYLLLLLYCSLSKTTSKRQVWKNRSFFVFGVTGYNIVRSFLLW